METGILVKSTTFHTTPYWVVKCDGSKVMGAKNGELPIDPLTFDQHGAREGMRVMFTVQKVGDLENCKWYAALRDKTKSMGQRGYPRNTERNPFKDDAEMLEWYGLQPQDVCWKSELQVGVENASPRVHEKLFSYEDVCRAMQGEHNATYWAQRVLYRLQAMVESK